MQIYTKLSAFIVRNAQLLQVNYCMLYRNANTSTQPDKEQRPTKNTIHKQQPAMLVTLIFQLKVFQ